MKKWLVIPIICFIFIEIALSNWSFVSNSWYRGFENKIKKEKVDLLFIGSSRVASAINIKTIEEDFNLKAYNLGVGFSTIHSHALGIYNLLEKYPEKFRGMKVLIEAPSGIIDSNGFNDKWFFDSQPRYIVEEITFTELKRFWNSSHSLSRKIQLSFRSLLSFSKLFTFKERLRDSIMEKIFTSTQRVLAKLGLSEKNKINNDLSKDGNVRNDEAGIKAVQEFIIESVKREIKNPIKYTSFRDSRVYELIEKLKISGAEVIVYTMPVSPLKLKVYNIHKEDILKFQKDLKTNFIKFIPYEKNLSIEYFPDFLHMRKSYSSEFTKELMGKL